ncbi:DUF6933 domain-containing protein [Algibacter sp. Ld11]|uniref:DUF6933 domain-containing protein n=1 Tax=Algibacter sp. Ld11 TaxID=649150 RepID=UPI00386B61D6
MQTPIHTSIKLEKFIKKLIQTKPTEKLGLLGKWNATVFHVNRKKCWLVANAKTQYSVILTDIKAKDLSNISEIFKNAFYTQLIYDGIIIDFENVNMLIGEISFFRTDNDRKTTGFQNDRLSHLEYWKDEFNTLEAMPIKDLTNRINNIPIHIGESKKMADFTYAKSEMKQCIEFILM